ncbi:uncharacterized protein [Musca autumnalis]|uniref:uncharacterized protein n=1 Tax=Musca autumnalis TaxID=221902 RepID=UPI003CF22C86
MMSDYDVPYQEDMAEDFIDDDDTERVYLQPHYEARTMLGLSMRLHILHCDDVDHQLDPKITEVRKFFHTLQVSFRMFDFDYLPECPQRIYDKLQSGMYIRYACIMVLLNIKCQCKTKILENVLQRIKENSFLRYKTKMVLCGYQLNTAFDMEYQPYTNDLIVDKFPQQFTTTGCTYLYRPTPLWVAAKRPVLEGDISVCDADILADNNVFRKANADNTLLMQYFTQRHTDFAFQMESIAVQLAMNPLISVNELSVVELMSDFIVQASANADYYFYSINPTLAIISNTYHFTNDKLKARQGSEVDVRRIIRELKIAHIPFILLQDCTRGEYMKIIEYIKHSNLRALKTLMLFLMSHGNSGNVVYASDGELNLFEDIIIPIEANRTLANVEKLLVCNFCRGPIDYEYATYRDLAKVKPTYCPHLGEKFTLMCSVANGVAAPRDIEYGSPFIEIFCELFHSMQPDKDLHNLQKEIDKRLRKVDYYCGVDKRSDLVMGNSNICHTIFFRSRSKAREMIDLVKLIIQDFPQLIDTTGLAAAAERPKSLFYICGSLKNIPENSSTNKYFLDKYLTKELDSDQRGNMKTLWVKRNTNDEEGQ